MTRETQSQKTARIRREEKRAKEAQCAKYKVGDVVTFTTGKGFRHGHIVEKIGCFFKIKHPNGTVYSIEVDAICKIVKHCSWPGLCDNLVNAQDKHASIEQLDRWTDVLAEIEASASADEKVALRALLRPLEYARKVLVRVKTVLVVEVKEDSPEYKTLSNTGQSFNHVTTLLGLSPREVNVMELPTEGYVWFYQTSTGLIDRVKQ